MSDLHNLPNVLPQSKFEMVTDTASVVAIASPWWLPYLKETSEIAALLLPIFGVTWLAIQIGFKFYKEWKAKPNA
jgi:hypothetical protein